MYNYIEELKKAIGILKAASQAQSILALRPNFSMSIHDFDQLPNELRLTVIAFLKEAGFRMHKWNDAQYKDKPGGSWSLRLGGDAEFIVYDGRLIGNEQ